jgi:enoyl-CoA hydratase/3-hydroxyacyl-CoA dehydrogenase
MLKTSVLFYQFLKLSEKDIVEMVFFPVINEACRVLDEGIAVKASDLDIASIFGMGFPPYRSSSEYSYPIFFF